MRVVRVVNQSRQRTLAERADVAATWWQRGRGLLGRSGLEPGAGLLIVPCNSIHSFFMRFAFDAVFIDKQLRILHVIPAMPPYRLSRIVRRAWAVLELPAGVVQATATQVGDQLAIATLESEG
ncbi:MAG: DUF192 domain-containing protein [Chloroflexi bacterium]|nr:DUF192 domain-containing protein [Chloroflexota bacterium]